MAREHRLLREFLHCLSGRLLSDDFGRTDLGVELYATLLGLNLESELEAAFVTFVLSYGNHTISFIFRLKRNNYLAEGKRSHISNESFRLKVRDRFLLLAHLNHKKTNGCRGLLLQKPLVLLLENYVHTDTRFPSSVSDRKYVLRIA